MRTAANFVKMVALLACALVLAYFAGYESSGLPSLAAAIGGVASFALATR